MTKHEPGMSPGHSTYIDEPAGYPIAIAWRLSRGRVLRWEPGAYTLVYTDGTLKPFGTGPTTAPTTTEQDDIIDRAEGMA